jgi:mannose-6-phosphate isomerase-like protein (cupin superfamily)
MSRQVDKPWGHEEIWAETEDYIGKILFIREGERLSLQHHDTKREDIRMLSGKMQLDLENASGEMVAMDFEPGMSVHIAPGRRHRMTAMSDVTVLEVSTPHLDDVVRHEDDYGRLA